ncbi:MAG: hypothetical protein MR051_08820 [Lentisphaeria bacterium]|nr:hypothetical protein [Lentisphaeria bacterium]
MVQSSNGLSPVSFFFDNNLTRGETGRAGENFQVIRPVVQTAQIKGAVKRDVIPHKFILTVPYLETHTSGALDALQKKNLVIAEIRFDQFDVVHFVGALGNQSTPNSKPKNRLKFIIISDKVPRASNPRNDFLFNHLGYSFDRKNKHIANILNTPPMHAST